MFKEKYSIFKAVKTNTTKILQRFLRIREAKQEKVAAVNARKHR